MNFPKYVHFSGLKLSDALEEFAITSQFFSPKMQKIICLKKISVLDKVLSNWSAGDYNPILSTWKHHQTLDFFLMTDF